MLLVVAGGTVPLWGAGAATGDPGRTDWISDPTAIRGGYEDKNFVRGLSDNGRFALFESTVPVFVADLEDVNGYGPDVFRRDMTTGRVVAVSTSAASPSRTGNGFSSESNMSADGRFVAFSSHATDLDPAVADAANQDVFLRDMEEGWTRLISRAHSGDRSADSSSGRPRISRDGRYVVFESQARNLIGDVTGGMPTQLYRYDRLAGGVELVSVNAAGRPADRDVREAGLSDDARFVAFSTWATNLVPGGETIESNDVFRRDLVAGTTELVSRTAAGSPAGSSRQPVISGDGTAVAFVATDATTLTGAGDSNGLADDVFVWEAGTGVELVSATAAGASTPNGVSTEPSISADGDTVVFLSTGTDLVAGVEDANNLPPGTLPPMDYPQGDVFVHRRPSGTTALVSRSASDPGRTGDRGSTKPTVSADGSTVVFGSNASDLVGGVDDRNGDTFLADVFAYRISDGSMRVVSVDDSAPSATLPGGSFSPLATPDGAFVAFDYRARPSHRQDPVVWFLAARRSMGPSLPPPPPAPNGAPPADFSNPPGESPTTAPPPTTTAPPPPTAPPTTTSRPPTTAPPVAASTPTCFGRPATLIGTAGDDRFSPTGGGPIVIVGLGGRDTYIRDSTAGPAEVYFCGGAGNDTASGVLTGFDGGSGKDTLKTAKCTKPRKIKSVEQKKISSRCPTTARR